MRLIGPWGAQESLARHGDRPRRPGRRLAPILGALVLAVGPGASAADVQPLYREAALGKAELQASDPSLAALFLAAEADGQAYEHWGIAQTWVRLGDRLLARDDAEGARKLYGRVAALSGSIIFAEYAAVGRARMGRIAAVEGRHQEALNILTAAAAEIAAGPGDIKDRHLGSVLGDRADVLAAMGRYADALAATEEALKTTTDDGLRMLQIRAGALEGLRRWPEAEALRSRALGETSMYAETQAAGARIRSPLYATGQVALAHTIMQQGRAAQAEPLLQQALGAFEAAYPEDHSEVLGARTDLARVRLEGLDQPDAALREARRAGRALTESPTKGGERKLDRFRDVFRVQVAAAWRLAEGRPAPGAPTAPAAATAPIATKSMAARHGSDVSAILFLPEGRLATSAQKGGLIIWDLRDGTVKERLSPEVTGLIYRLAAGPQGSVYWRSVGNGRVKAWRPGEAAPFLDLNLGSDFRDFAVTANASIVSIGHDPKPSDRASIRVSSPTGALLATQPLPAAVAERLVLSPQGDLAYVSQYDNAKASNDPTTFPQVCSYRLPDLRPVECAKGAGRGGQLTLTADGERLLAEHGSQAAVLRASDLSPVSVFPIPYAVGASVSPNGDRAVLATQEGHLQMLNLADGTLGARLDGHTGAITALGFSPLGDVLVSGSADRTVRVWDSRTGAPRHVLGGDVRFARHTHDIRRAVFSPDGRRVASAGGDGTRIWDPETGVQLEIRPGLSVDWSRDGKSLVSHGGISDAETGAVRAPFPPETFRGETVFLEDGSVLAEGKVFGRDGKMRRVLTTDPFTRVVPAPRGALVAVLSMTAAQYQVIDALTGETVMILPPINGLPPQSASFSGDGATVVVSYFAGVVRIDLKARKAISAYDTQGVSWDTAVVAPDGRRAAAIGLNWLYLWPDETAPRLEMRTKSKVMAALFSPDGANLAVALADGSTHLYDAATGALRHVLSGHSGQVQDLKFSPDGSRLLTISEDRTMGVWSVSDGRLVSVLGG